MKNYDAIVIGSGQAGTPLAKKLAMAGKKTAIIEKRYIGGTCINDGCTPTKTMVASAKAAYMAGKAEELGVNISSFSVDMQTIKKRKDDVVYLFRNGSQNGLEKTDNLDIIFGEASFTGEKELLVKLKDGGTETLQADLIFINAGTQTAIPAIPGLDTINYLTSTSIMELNEIPEHLLIIGASYIGMEFGQMFRRFGSKVTMLEHSERALPREDEDVAGEIVKLLEQEGIVLHNNATATQIISKAGGVIEVGVAIGNGEKKIKCSHVLIAAGRHPQTQALHLNKAGIECDNRGAVKVNAKLETNIPGIYALGDVNGGPAFTHIAYNDYTIVYRNLVEGGNFSTTDRLVPYCMFTDPQLGRIGITEAQATARGLNFKVAKLPMEHVARAIEKGDTRGFMKAIVDADTKKILGAAIIGEEGGEIMAVLQMAMMGGITYPEIRYCVFAHPTFSESLNNLFMKLDA